MGCAHDALLRALKRRAGGKAFEVREARSSAWASATFSGSRHRFALALSGPDAIADASRFTEGLEVSEFDLPGHLVADIAVVSREDLPGCSNLSIEALTVEEC